MVRVPGDERGPFRRSEGASSALDPPVRLSSGGAVDVEPTFVRSPRLTPGNAEYYRDQSRDSKEQADKSGVRGGEGHRNGDGVTSA